MKKLNRRTFIHGTLGLSAATVAGSAALSGFGQETNDIAPILPSVDRKDYRGPNVIIIRFGGGVRRKETIEAATTYSPFLVHELIPKGTFFPKMEIAQIKDLATSHGEGTLNILTGKYGRYKDVGGRLFGARFEAKVPTVFEYLRRFYTVPEHQTLIINGEDRIDEEFYTFSNHHMFGTNFRSNVLSLYRFKTFLLAERIRAGEFEGKELAKKEAELEKMSALDHRAETPGQSPEIQAFWKNWKRYYGITGFVNPRGDRLLTELTIRAMKQLRPRLVLVNYNDCDYVHWGNASHYTRGISIMDEGLKDIYAAVQSDEEYRDNTVIVVVPDCGRDTNSCIEVPFQHHFGGRSAHEIFGLFIGPGFKPGQIVDRVVQQVDVAQTIGHAMGFKCEFAEGKVLSEAIG
ncbi:MAG: hypothetical protein O2857_07725 [Planctomycetota bacterium]|nr:hypothetical protein [Planctomycetota bacterium]